MEPDLKEQLRFLRLPVLETEWDRKIEEAAALEPSYSKFLRGIIEAECIAKRERARLTRLKRARIPEHWAMETYPFHLQPKLNRKQCLEIYDSKSYLLKNEHLALIGPTGVGKTGLASAFLIHAINEGHTGQFIEFAELLGELNQAMAVHEEQKCLKTLLQYDCLLIDEMGYIEVESKAQAGLLFRLLRNRKKCTIVTSNLGYSEWPSFLKNEQLSAALLEKFTANCHLINMLSCKSITPRKIEGPEKK